MAKKKPLNNHRVLKPLHAVLFVSDEDTHDEIPAESVTPQQVGEKAFGLSCLPELWTLPFFVVSDELRTLYNSSPVSDRLQVLQRWAEEIIKVASLVGIQMDESIIVRSSGCSEGLSERGKFYSSAGILKDILKPLSDCLEELTADKSLDKEKVPLVVQKYVHPFSAKGHFSNERRFYVDKRDWLGEFIDKKNKTGKAFQINLRNWREKIDVVTNKPLECNLTPHVAETLKIPATWASESGVRLHFEWVWDGKVIYLVQADQERETKGVDPTKIHSSKPSVSPAFVSKCLKLINESYATRYNKIANVITYIKLGLPTTKLYVLDNQVVIENLASGRIPSDLEYDLKELVKGSLVIRMDIATENIKSRQLLPRTEEVRELGSALDWLKKQCAEIKVNANIQEDVVFIFHNFIPSVSSAFAYAAPGERKVLIEALWGLPEGLYYNAHDKYIVDTKIPQGKKLCHDDMGRFVVRERPTFKRSFVAPDINGHWTTQVLRQPYDWKGSIQNEEWVKEIALESRRIAEEEEKPLSIMWFVGVPTNVCSMPVLPWYHEPYDAKITSRAPALRTKTPFDESLVIKTSADIDALRQEANNRTSRVRRIRIQPSEEALLRDKDTLCLIGELAQKIGAVILLEGGVLSHAYYQLIKTNATVEVSHPFEDFDEKQDFNKLVRDKVPSNIEGGGEVVSKVQLSGEFLMRALREKLIEESFEVLDALDQDSIVGELADVNEIIDGILFHLGINRDELQKRQDQKRDKAGGFKEGLVLLETKNPLPIKKDVNTDITLFDNSGDIDKRDGAVIMNQDLTEFGHGVSKKWTDRREHNAVTETILNLVIPMVMDTWTDSTPEMVIDPDSGKSLRVKISGERSCAKLKIDLSIYVSKNLKKQLELLLEESSKGDIDK